MGNPRKERSHARTPRRTDPRPIDAGARALADRINRDASVRALYADNWRVGDIAYRYGLTMFRVYQIIASPKLGVSHQLWGAWRQLAADGNLYAKHVIELVELSEAQASDRAHETSEEAQ